MNERWKPSRFDWAIIIYGAVAFFAMMAGPFVPWLRFAVACISFVVLSSMFGWFWLRFIIVKSQPKKRKGESCNGGNS